MNRFPPIKRQSGWLEARLLPRRLLLVTLMFSAIKEELVAADGPIDAVQNALRREQFLYPEPSGVLDDATRDALRRFQVSRGLPATGEMDTPTLEALQTTAPRRAAVPPMIAPTQAEKPDTVEKDREFLKQVETSQAQPPPKLEQ